MPTYTVQVQAYVINLGERQVTIPNIVADTLEEACQKAKDQLLINVEVLAAQKTA